MSWETMAATISDRFDSVIAVPESVTTLYDNDPTDKPQHTMWVHFTLQEGETFVRTLGTVKTYRTPGIATAQIFIPVGQGDKDALALADKIKTAFRAIRVSGVVFKTPSVRRVGRTDSWWQLNVSCPFYADEAA